MIELMSNLAPHVVAFRIDGSMAAEDVEGIFDTIEKRLGANEAINLYAEIVDLGGMTLGALLEDLARSLGLLGRLGQIGRYAVVTDTAWIRTVAGIEDTLLPGLTIRTFGLDEHDAAAEWVVGAATA